MDLRGTILHGIPIVFEQNEHKRLVRKITDFTTALDKKKQSHDYWGDKRRATKPKYDNRIGKYAEVAVAKYIHSLGYPLIDVDFEIREGGKKGWWCDLPYGDLGIDIPNCHVKACSEYAYRLAKDYTWTFQYANKAGSFGGKDILFKSIEKTSNDLIFLTYVSSIENPQVVIIASSFWFTFYKILRDPRKPELKGIKKCLYYKDIYRLKNQTEV